ncbi:MAG: hypothetical protein HYZ49_06645 [Chloroflexi bacterium]|nr:hypothetical protein [Chloroflexota bacterium]
MSLPDLLLTLSNILASFNQILTAAIVVTAFSLLLYSLTFNLHDRVARSYSVMLVAISIVYLGDVVASINTAATAAEPWLRFQWLGIVFLPPTYLHFSDALLATTGLPSRGRRRVAVRLAYLAGMAWVALAAFTEALVAEPAIEGRAQQLLPGPLFLLFAAFFALGSTVAWTNLYRAYQRCLTATTRRRMNYLMVASVALPLSVFPYLLIIGGSAAILHPFIFWVFSVIGNLIVGAMLTLMSYTVAFFGTAQPDRVIKGRLFQWLLRGPFVASIALAVLVLTSRAERWLGLEQSQAVPLAVIGALLLLQYVITLVRIPLERLLFYGGGADRADLQRLQILEERLLTAGDTRQFLESVVAAVCDLLRVQSAFVAVVGPDGARLEAKVGPDELPANSSELTRAVMKNGSAAALGNGDLFVWEHYWVLPLHAQSEEEGLAQPNEILGLLALRARAPQPDLTADEVRTLQALAERAAAALEDRRLQEQVFAALDSLLPQVDRLQRLRAAARYSSSQVLEPDPAGDSNLAQYVRDALTQYWGGPKLTQSPLLRLKVVERALKEHDGNPANALRAVLHDAIERIKPEGQRKFTAEWILYNILELKFMQGKRVREVALKLAVSEADLYRKQRVAFEQVAQAISEMENEMNNGAAQDVDYSVAG